MRITTTTFTMLALLAGCTGELVGTTAPPPPDEDPWTDLEQVEREGPPRYTSRIHSCAKIRYTTLGNLLASRGVDLAATDDLAAGKIYKDGAGALGAENYAARTREVTDLGIATTSKLFDIFVQAAPEIIAKLPLRPECQGAQLFDAQNRCVSDGFACLMGLPPTQAHLDLCNLTIARAEDVESGKRLAVAVMAAAAHTCE